MKPQLAISQRTSRHSPLYACCMYIHEPAENCVDTQEYMLNTVQDRTGSSSIEPIQFVFDVSDSIKYGTLIFWISST